MNDATMNFLYAMIIGRSVSGHAKGDPLKYLWDYQPWVDFFIYVCTDSMMTRYLVEASMIRNRAKRANAE